MTAVQMLDGKHVKVIWAGRPRQLTHVVSSDMRDVRRRAFTPSFTVSQPLVRRPSFDSSAVSKTKTLSVKRETSVIAQTQPTIHRAHSFRDVIVRESAPRKQTTVPVATKLTHEPEIKPILKSGKGSYVLPTADDKPSEESESQNIGPDGKFCYKLPNTPATKLRKTVSFKEDMVSSRTILSYKRHLKSPVLSIRNGGFLADDSQVFV